MRFYLSKKILLGVLSILPLLRSYHGFGYEQIKVIFFILSTTLIGFLWVGKGFKWTLISIVAGLFILVLLITSLSGLNIENSLLGIQPYFQSWILYLYLYLLYLIVKTFKIEIKNYALVLSISASIVAFLAIYDWVFVNIFNQPIPTYAGRVVSTFGQPNFYAGFLLLTLPFAYFLLKDSNKKLQYLGWSSGLISTIGIFVSYSRSAILLTLFLLLLGLIDQLKIMFKTSIIVFGIVFISILIALKFSSGIGGSEIIKPISTHDPDLTQESVEKRIYIWPQAIKVALQKTLTGYGLENIRYAFASYFEQNKHPLFEENLKIYPVLISFKDLNLDRTHNYILDILLFSGLLGLAIWVFLIATLVRRLILSPINSKTKTLLSGLFIYLIWIQFQNQSVVHLVYFWLLIGLIDKKPNRSIDKAAEGM